MSGTLTIIEPSEATMLEIASLAADKGIVLVERAGVTALCSQAHIPEGWHRAGVRVKQGSGHATPV